MSSHIKSKALVRSTNIREAVYSLLPPHDRVHVIVDVKPQAEALSALHKKEKQNERIIQWKEAQQ